ncbi:thyroid receptor-interacting protein 11-like [Brevipalpus obovatus]|uniref:thyroid receptor-interacting protein 11-like n=1 Tax=Brevipalpus obovatus TaxID=246614 RepID=UPI003D9E6E67
MMAEEESESLKSELKRLKDHLITVEEEYTQEILAAEKREANIREELEAARQIETQLRSELASISQSSKWQEKLAAVIVERDKALEDLSKLDDRSNRLTASVTNLQLVVEQMQKENEKKLAQLSNQHAAALEAERSLQSNLRRELELYEAKYQETSQALQAASRLTERIDKKESIIDGMKQEISKRENRIAQLEKEISDLKSSYEGKVDKQIIKNLVLGYFGTPLDKKHEVERLLARILDFNQEEMSRAGLSIARNSSTARLSTSSLHSPHKPITSSSPGGSGDSFNTSLSKMFVEFLENESSPKPNNDQNQSSLTRELARDFTRLVTLTPTRASASNTFADRQLITPNKSSANGPPSSNQPSSFSYAVSSPSSSTSTSTSAFSPSPVIISSPASQPSAIGPSLTPSPSSILINSVSSPLTSSIPPIQLTTSPLVTAISTASSKNNLEISGSKAAIEPPSTPTFSIMPMDSFLISKPSSTQSHHINVADKSEYGHDNCNTNELCDDSSNSSNLSTSNIKDV